MTLLSSCTSKRDNEFNIIPEPKLIEKKSGTFTINNETKIYADLQFDNIEKIVSYLNGFLEKSSGLKLNLVNTKPESNFIYFEFEKQIENEEAYTFESDNDGIVISASESNGLFYGVQTLLQLLPAQVYSQEKVSFNLTIPSLPGTSYSLTMAVSPAGTGTATDVTNASPYAPDVQVSIQAVAAPGYHFVNWTAPAGSFTNASSATTTFTMPGQDVTVTANFEAGGAYTLTMAASPIMGGTAYDVTGTSPYNEGEIVSIQATAASGYQFAGWAAPAGSLANAYASATTFTMPGQDVVVTATFQVSSTTSGICFIATAAYGSSTAGQIDRCASARSCALVHRCGAGTVGSD